MVPAGNTEVALVPERLETLGKTGGFVLRGKSRNTDLGGGGVNF